MKIKSALFTLGMLLSAITAPDLTISAAEMSTQNSDEHGYKQIDAKELKSWIDAKKPMQIVDARPKKYDDGDVIQGAKFLPYDADANAIAKALPSKDSVIVTYCASIKCPASTYLTKELVRMGYTNVYKYPGGLADWMEKGYPTQKASK